jgi:ABC-type nitrate/sulfonate/bicarbonate transport system permease component
MTEALRGPERWIPGLTAGNRWLPAALGVAVLLACWTLAALLGGGSRHVVPLPTDVVRTMISDGFYLPSVAVTGWEALRGFIAGNLIALAMATVCLLVPATELGLTRIAAASYCAPAVAVGPVLSVLLSQDQAKVIIAALSVLFTTLLGTVYGLAQTPASALDLVHVTGGNRWFALTRVRVRAAMPAIIAALGLSAPSALLGAIVGEYLGGDRGLGVALVQAQQALEVPRTWALALLSTGLAGLMYLVISLLGRRLRFVAVTSEAAQAPGRNERGTARTTLPGIAGVTGKALAATAGTVLIWWAVVTVPRLDPYLAKTPMQVIVYLVGDPEAAKSIPAALGVTLRDALGGYLAGTVLAVLLALFMLSSRFAEAMVLPVALALRSIPLVAMTPLIALIFGRGLLGVTVLATSITLVPTLVNVVAALHVVPAPAIELTRAYAMGWTRSMVTVRLRYALPALAVSARIAIPGALLGATLSEYLVTSTGLGGLISVATSNSDFDALWAAVVVVTTVSVVLFSGLTWLENIALRRLVS